MGKKLIIYYQFSELWIIWVINVNRVTYSPGVFPKFSTVDIWGILCCEVCPMHMGMSAASLPSDH